MIRLNPMTRRRLANFKRNRRAVWGLRIFVFLFVVTLFAELIANDRPIYVNFDGAHYFPVINFYSEAAFGGEFETEAEYRDPAVACLIATGGIEDCLDAPDATAADNPAKGWAIWPPIRFSYDTVNYATPSPSPSYPTRENLLGTDDASRDLAARLIYGFRISVLFGLTLTLISTFVGVIAGAVQGFFGGWIDLIFQRFIEIWSAMPFLYLIIILSAFFEPTFWTILFIVLLFSWMALVGVVRAEFLRARNFEYVQAARALGLNDWKIMFRHVLPNAMVASITFMPFILSGSITTLTALDFLGFGLPLGSPSLGEALLQGRNNLHAPWIGISAFAVIATLLSLLVFIFEGVRDAFDPRKTFQGGGDT